MNAIQFIKEHGVEKAREVVSGAPDLAEYYSTIDGEYYRIELHAVNLRHLKRLVESVELINGLKGIDEARSALQNIVDNHASNKYAMNFEKPALEKAIADYEAIYSNDIKIEVSFGISLMPSERLACIDLTPRPVIDCEILDYPEDYTSPNCKKFDERVK